MNKAFLLLLKQDSERFIAARDASDTPRAFVFSIKPETVLALVEIALNVPNQKEHHAG